MCACRTQTPQEARDRLEHRIAVLETYVNRLVRERNAMALVLRRHEEFSVCYDKTFKRHTDIHNAQVGSVEKEIRQVTV